MFADDGNDWIWTELKVMTINDIRICRIAYTVSRLCSAKQVDYALETQINDERNQ